jgi:hypothetical protein
LYRLRKVRGNIASILVTIFLLAAIIALPTSMMNITITATNRVYGQPNGMDIDTGDLPAIQDIPLEKVRVGDIDIAYKRFGNGEPILLLRGASAGVDS